MANCGEKVPSASPTARVVLQQCLSARLMITPAKDELPPQYVEINRGIVAYICFLKGATSGIIEKIAKTILGIRLSSSEEGKLVSILDLPGDVLIVPQATLGGRAKGKSMQYHMNIDKESGRSLYQEFCDECKNQILKSPKCQEAGTSFHHGTYGNTQVLKLDTNGPYTHLIEF